VIALAILEASQASKARAEMPEGDAWNTGSVFAAGTQCEMKGYMAQGQTTPLMVRYMQRLPAIDAEGLRDGYQQGLKRTAIYSKNNNGWFPYPLTAEGCSKIQFAITQYKIALATIVEGEAGHLTGSNRAQFVAGVADKCMSGYGKDERTSQIPRPFFEKYCQCYANGLADRASMNDLKEDNEAVMQPIIDAETKRCYAEIKAEAIRIITKTR
jgi:hypothetical protein